ncbi:MAG: diguanylate cyclase [Burkholderiaceae bacterium]|nr:diguanylate cyclase [Burkholderiaceae bacterium]
MNSTSTNSASPAPAAPAELARAALRHLAQRRLPPTPDQYSLAWRAVGGSMPDGRADAQAAAQLPDIGPVIAELLRQLDVSHRHWTSARKKEALGRMLAVHGSDPRGLAERLQRLIDSWRECPADAPVSALAPEPASQGADAVVHVAEYGVPADEVVDATPAQSAPVPAQAAAAVPSQAVAAPQAEATVPAPGVAAPVSAAAAVPAPSPAAAAAPTPSPAAAAAPTQSAAAAPADGEQLPSLERVLGDMTDLLVAVCETVPTLVEEEAWVRQQFDTIRAILHPAEGLPDRRDLVHARALLRRTANEHQRLLKMRRDSLQMMKTMIAQCIDWLRALTESSGRFGNRLSTFAEEIERSNDLPALAGTVRHLIEETRSMYTELEGSRNDFAQAGERARQLEEEVSRLETELSAASTQVMTDHLTNLLNRRGLEQSFEDLAERCRAEGRPLSLALLDVDNFKRLNDALGHQAGDDALRHLARLLRSRVRSSDLSARYGGEEFVILLPGATEEQAAEVVRGIQRSLTTDVFLHHAQRVFITFSAGVAQVVDGSTLEETVARADDAMYEAKRAGKNRVCIAARVPH